MNDEGIPTPRNLPGRNLHAGSGTLPEPKRSMDDGDNRKQTAEGQEMLEHVQSATQSQQFKTLDESKKGLSQVGTESGEIGLKGNFGEEAPAQPLQVPADHFSKETSEPGLPENDVIVEQDEHDEEERKTQTETFKLNKEKAQMTPTQPPATIEENQYATGNKLASQESQNDGYNNSGPSTVHGDVSGNNIVGSQSRIKVNLSQHEDDTLGMVEEPEVIQPMPTLDQQFMS